MRDQPSVAELLARLQEEAVRRERVEEELTRLRAALDTMQLGVTITDLDGTILYVNPADARMHGYTVPELLGRDVSVFAPRDVPRQPLTPSGMEQLTTWQRDSRNVRKDGSEMVVQLLSDVVRDAEGCPLGIVTTCQDVTERARAEEALRSSKSELEGQLRQAQKLEAVGQLTGGIAHDFNNILSVVLANADFLMAGLTAETEHLRGPVQDIRTAGESGATLIRQLLGFSRRAELTIEPVDLRRLVVDFTGVLRHLIREDIEVLTHVDGPARTVLADAGAIQQILMNLATNARDAMPSGGTLRLTVTAAELDDSYRESHPWIAPGKYACIEFSDTGVGMDEATRSRIFEPFFTTKPAGRGTGLGMAMTYGLMKQLRGFVHVYSELGRGTSIKLYFPLCGARAAAPETPVTAAPARGGAETVLLAEDEDSLRRAAQRALERLGYTVLAAANGAEALALYRTHRERIQLVISDLVMPRLGGRELYEAIRREDGQVAFLFASGYSAQDVRERAALAPGMPFLRKPWTLDELDGQVRAALSRAGR